MQAVVGIVIVGIVLIGLANQWIDTHPVEAKQLAVVCAGLFIAYVIYSIRTSRWYLKKQADHEYKLKQEREELARQREAKRIQDEIAKEEATFPDILDSQKFRAALLDDYYKACPRPVIENVLNDILFPFEECYKPQTKKQSHMYRAACLQGLVDFTKKIPADFLRVPEVPSIFHIKRNLRDLAMHKIKDALWFRPEYAEAYSALCKPFRNQEQNLSFMNWNITGPLSGYSYPRGENDTRNQREYDKATKKYSTKSTKITRLCGRS